MDTRTQQLLIGKGVMDTQRVTARPTTRHCRTCRQVVLVALADDGPQVAGVRVTLDPRPLTPYGELQALMAGRLTYHHTGGHIAWRDPVLIARKPAHGMNVHATHKCHSPLNAEHRETPPTYSVAHSDPTVIPF